MSLILPGVCRYCRCTEDNACMLQTGEPCCWYDKSRTVCSNPSCITQYETARRAAAEAAKPPRRTSADVNALIRSRGRKKKGRAA